MVTAGAAAALSLPVAEEAELAAPSVAELTASLTERVYDARADVSEARSEPVAVAMADEKELRAESESLVMERTLDDAADVMDDRADEADEDRDATADDRLDESEAMADEAEAVESVVLVWACLCWLARGAREEREGGRVTRKKNSNIPRPGRPGWRGWRRNASWLVYWSCWLGLFALGSER